MYMHKFVRTVEVPKTLNATIGIPQMEVREAVGRLIGRFTRLAKVTDHQIDQVMILIKTNYEKRHGRSNLTYLRMCHLTDKELSAFIPAVQQRLQ